MFGLVADDVTGANATAARVAARAGIAGRVLLDAAAPGPLQRPAETGGGGAPALWVVPTHSRAVEPAEARRRVREAVAALRRAGCRHFGKRIDSTLRGNLGAELAGALDALPDHLAVVVAAFPASGRATVGGRLRVHGAPLLATEAARDPITPVTDDHVARLLAAQSGLAVTYLPPGPAGYDGRLPAQLAQLHRSGSRVVVLDAARDEDIEAIAALVARVPVPVLAVDPGPFFAAWVAWQLGRCSPDPVAPLPAAGPWLVVAGSLTALTDRQLDALTRRWPVPRLHAPLDDLLADPKGCAAALLPQAAASLQRWGLAIVETDRRRVVATEGETAAVRGAAAAPGAAAGGTVTGREAAAAGGAVAGPGATAVAGTAAHRVARHLATLAASLVDRLPDLAGLVLTGGDTAAAVAAALGATSLRITGELAPLVAGGSLEGGRRPGLAVITKGGLVGDEDLLVRLLEPRVRPAAAAAAAAAGAAGSSASETGPAGRKAAGRNAAGF
ncbi:type III effector Hrp-dependent outer [Thermaerobacter marianensis DSM 12885]|uniref:Type III effector Hrp-dependent outer n=1 Tax=Thermaerobacter marianensis (strain ATCC 700841 / DSM 12885 / JCM 10246 / 7p75a) TaxID=644966 RepID=E6SJ77_THEM7|nr:four-carbon acid sugar kinase family protein [Thermaerobacter marianensis]ADU52101.1 type III effector Hrp-dependent outer [Thermaerobacter marianensis DSM 12885]